MFFQDNDKKYDNQEYDSDDQGKDSGEKDNNIDPDIGDYHKDTKGTGNTSDEKVD